MPPLTLLANGTEYGPVAVNALVTGPDGQALAINQPLDPPIQRIAAAPGTIAQVIFRGARPGSVIASLLTPDGETLLNLTRLPADNVSLYTFPASSGAYLLAIEIVFPQGSATYLFRLAISG